MRGAARGNSDSDESPRIRRGFGEGLGLAAALSGAPSGWTILGGTRVEEGGPIMTGAEDGGVICRGISDIGGPCVAMGSSLTVGLRDILGTGILDPLIQSWIPIPATVPGVSGNTSE